MNVGAAMIVEEKLPPAPETTVQAPVWLAGSVADKVAEVVPQGCVWSEPALADEGLRGKVIITSSVLLVQGALAMVQRKV